MGQEEAAALPLEGIKLADDIRDRAFKKIRHARQAIEVLWLVTQQLAVQGQDIERKRKTTRAR